MLSAGAALKDVSVETYSCLHKSTLLDFMSDIHTHTLNQFNCSDMFNYFCVFMWVARSDGR